MNFGLNSNIKIGSEEEINVLKGKIIDEVLEEIYENEDNIYREDIIKYMDKNGDEEFKKLLFTNISFLDSIPFYKEWINQNITEYSIHEQIPDMFYLSKMGILYIKYIIENCFYYIRGIRKLKEKLLELYNLNEVLTKKVYDDKNMLLTLDENIFLDIIILSLGIVIEEEKTSKLYEYIKNIEFTRWTTNKDSKEILEEIKLRKR